MSAMISPGVNLVMTLIGFAVSTMFIVFVCTRLICARIHLNASARSFPTAPRSDLSMLEQGLHGLDPVLVATFPTKKYGDGFFQPVKMFKYQDKDILRILPSCGHFFHVACIDVWLRQHSTCPVCRISLRQSPDRRHPMQPMFSSAVQSTYSTDSPNSHSYHFLYVRYGYSSSGVGSQRMEPIQVDHLASEVHTAESGDSISIFTRGNRAPKDIGLHEPGKLHHESPSNS